MEKNLSKSEKRKKFIFEILLEHEAGKVEKVELLAQVRKILKQEIGIHAITDTLNRIKKEKFPEYDLTVGTTYAMLELVEVTSIGIAEGNQVEMKRNLGIVLWNFIFNLNLAGGKGLNHKYHEHSKKLDSKLKAIRKKTNVSILVDAGSSTSEAMNALMEVERVPFKVNSKDEKTMLVRPRIITNSISIANVVAKSDHKNDLQVRIIGGDLRIDRRSICGSLSDMCLEAWNQRADLALIGTTGYRNDLVSGVPGFGCDDIAEARLKGAMLEMAWLRVLIFDSSKLNTPEVSNIFSPLSDQMLDLVVTDDGAKNGAADMVHQLCVDAKEANVNALILDT